MEHIYQQLSEKHVIGTADDDTQLYVELKYVYSITGQKILNVFHINVPVNDRHTGIATSIIEICEKIAQAEHLIGIWVGPFVTDESDFLAKICGKRKYYSCMPFGMIKQFREHSPNTQNLLIPCVIDEDTHIKINKNMPYIATDGIIQIRND